VQRALLAVFGQDAGSLFSFERQSFGAALALSDVYAAAEATGGVDHVLATLFCAETGNPTVAPFISVPDDALATGGSATDAAVGRVSLQLVGGLS
jgi:hypothetical protein